MTKRKRQGKRKSSADAPSGQAFRKEIGGLLLMALGVVTLLALIGAIRGPAGEAWSQFLRRLFGWGAWLVSLSSVVWGGLLLLRQDVLQTRDFWHVVVTLEALIVCILGLTHSLSTQTDLLALAEQGGGGGYVGWAIRFILETTLGRSAAILLLSLAVVALFSVSLSPFRTHIERFIRRRVDTLDEVLQEQTAEQEEEPVVVGIHEPPVRQAVTDPPPRVEPPRRSKARASTKPKPAKKRRRAKRDSRLPDAQIFEADGDSGVDSAGIRYRSQVIEETLSGFGVPAKVVEVRQGPAITQFGVEPGYVERVTRNGHKERRRVRVGRISTLAKDLALALAASPIRIEAPVPGRSVVGIEVPNTDISLVGLRGVIESESFRKSDSKLRIALGRDVAGEPMVVDLAAMPHLLIAGATGSGKSVCINSIIACLLYNNLPDDLSLLLIDPKRVELANFNGIPHLRAPVIVEVDQVVSALKWVTREMDRRYKMFAEAGKRNLTTYNRDVAGHKGAEKLPSLVIIIDELADLMLVAPDEVERSVCRIAQLARATGIHLVMATQRPSVDVVTGLIKANFPARISFAVTSLVDSRVILDSPGAEKLLGRGDMLFMSPDSSKLTRLQGCFVSDAELDRLVRFWCRDEPVPSAEPENPPWQEESFAEEQRDDLLDEAIRLVREQKKASTSWLQRQLRIGYPRAARLVDDLERMGIIGPAETGGRSRQVLAEDDSDANEPATSPDAPSE